MKLHKTMSEEQFLNILQAASQIPLGRLADGLPTPRKSPKASRKRKGSNGKHAALVKGRREKEDR